MSSGVRIGCFASFWYRDWCVMYFLVRPLIDVLRISLQMAVIFLFHPIQCVIWLEIGCWKYLVVACLMRCAARGCSRSDACSFQDGFFDLRGTVGVIVVVTHR